MWLNAPCHAIIIFYWFFVADFVGMTLGKTVGMHVQINTGMHVHINAGIIVGISVGTLFYLDGFCNVYTDAISD